VNKPGAVAVEAVAVEATEEAAALYRHFGFHELDDPPLWRRLTGKQKLGPPALDAELQLVGWQLPPLANVELRASYAPVDTLIERFPADLSGRVR
jgi:hypothetical protein